MNSESSSSDRFPTKAGSPNRILNCLFLTPFFCLLCLGLTFPSDGQHGLLSPKSLSFLASLMSLCCYAWVLPRLSTRSLKLFAWSAIALTFLIAWVFVALTFRDVDLNSAFDQLKLFVITFFFVVAAQFYVEEKLLEPTQFIRWVIFINFTYSLSKVVLVLFHLLGWINLWQVVETTGIRFMSMAIIGNIGRLQTSVDIVTPFLLFFVLESDALHLRLRPSFRLLYGLISFLSIALSFSRFLIFVALCACFLAWCAAHWRKKMQGVLFVVTCAFAIVGVFGISPIEQIIHQRFFSQNNYSSDLERMHQIESLEHRFDESVLVGVGMGGYAPDLIRDPVLKHSYEVQWMAFLMQFGVLGVLLLMIPLGWIASGFLVPSRSVVSISFFCLFILWVLAGWTNPYLISLTSGIVYALFLIAGDILQNTSHQEVEEPVGGKG